LICRKQQLVEPASGTNQCCASAFGHIPLQQARINQFVDVVLAVADVKRHDRSASGCQRLYNLAFEIRQHQPVTAIRSALQKRDAA